jgi:hypothetical protein
MGSLVGSATIAGGLFALLAGQVALEAPLLGVLLAGLLLMSVKA